MNEAHQLLDDGLRMQESVLGDQTFIYRGKHWPCCFAMVTEGTTLSVGGFEDDAEAILIVRKTAITSIRTADQNELWSSDASEPLGDFDVMPPKCGATIRAPNGLLYRIGTKIKNTMAAWTCPLISVNK